MYNNKHWKFEKQRNTKLGLHCQGVNNGVVNAQLELQLNVIKVMDFSFDYLNQIRNNRKDVFIIGRVFDQYQNIGNSIQEAEKLGKDYAAKCATFGKGLINAFETFNERVFSSTDRKTHELYDSFQFAFREQIKMYGYEAIAFNIPAGHGSDGEPPTFPWDLYPKTLSTYNYIGVHEYDWPALMSTPGEWLSLRYKRSKKEIERVYGNKHSWIITECGSTQGVFGGRDLGWRERNFTIPNNSIRYKHPENIEKALEVYYKGLIEYHNVLMKDPDVLGACLFDNAGWPTFEHVPFITNKIKSWISWLPLSIPAPTPITQPESEFNNMYSKGYDDGYGDGYVKGIKEGQEKYASILNQKFKGFLDLNRG